MSKHEKSCTKTAITALWISIISGVVAILSIWYICESNIAENSIQFNFGDASITILSILFALVVAFDIYALIDSKQFRNYTDERLKDYDHEISGALYHIYAIHYLSKQDKEGALFCIENGIEEQNKTDNPVYLKNLLKLLSEEYNIIDIKSKHKEKLNYLLQNVSCKDTDTALMINTIRDNLTTNKISSQ